MKKAVVLLSGGLDSATTLYYAKHKDYKAFALIFDYGQRHRKEVEIAKTIATIAGCSHHIVKINFPWKGSALLDKNIALPNRLKIHETEIPATYVPAVPATATA